MIYHISTLARTFVRYIREKADSSSIKKENAMEHNYSHALALTLQHEGHFVNKSHDKGGPTNEGITLATYRADIEPNGTVDSQINVSPEQIATEYRKKYWDKVRGDDLPDGLDFAVLISPLRAIRALQTVAGVAADGKLTAATLAAVLAIDTVKIIQTFSNYRLDYLKSLSDWQLFWQGLAEPRGGGQRRSREYCVRSA